MIEKGKSLGRNLKANLREETIEEDDPLYDKVPSDEDYASVASEPSSVKPNYSETDRRPHIVNNNKINVPDKNSQSSPLTVNTSNSPLHNSSILSQKSNRSNKNTPSPSGTRFTSKEHKVLTTNFDKPPSNLYSSSTQSTPQSQQQQTSSASTLVANAENALNSIINSLNQIDYSSQPQQSPNVKTSESKEQLNESFIQKGISLAAYTEIKNENELMQSMVSIILVSQ